MSTHPDRWATALLVFLFALTAQAADWHQWRGPTRGDITPEASGWPDGWPPQRLWHKQVGRGCTSPIIVGGQLYVMGWQGKGRLRDNPMGTDTLFCLDARSGDEIWKRSYPARYQGRRRAGDLDRYGGPSATPTWDPETQFLYTLSIDGDLRCWNTTREGEEVWSRNLYDDYLVPQRPDTGRGVRDYGYTTSPLVMGAILAVEVGGTRGTLMGFDKRTGDQIWTSDCTDPAGHTSGPVAFRWASVEGIADLTLFRLVIVRTDSGHMGETLAEYPWQTDFSCNIATPAVAEENIVLTSGYNQKKSARLQLTSEGIRERWSAKSHATVSSPVVYKGNLYLLSGSLQCLDFETGDLKWKGGRFGNGSLLATAGDDRLIIFGKGDVALVEAFPSDGRYRELARLRDVVPDVCYPHVILSDGFLCCKDKAGNMVMFDIQP